MFGLNAIFSGQKIHGRVSHPFGLWRQHGFHRPIRFGEVFHSATDHCEHGLIVVTLSRLQDDALVFSHRWRKLGGNGTATCSAANHKQFTSVQPIEWKTNESANVESETSARHSLTCIPRGAHLTLKWPGTVTTNRIRFDALAIVCNKWPTIYSFLWRCDDNERKKCLASLEANPVAGKYHNWRSRAQSKWQSK